MRDERGVVSGVCDDFVVKFVFRGTRGRYPVNRVSMGQSRVFLNSPSILRTPPPYKNDGLKRRRLTFVGISTLSLLHLCTRP